MLISRLDSTIGRKLLMAVTGLGLLGFVVGHLLGNVLVFVGPDAFNAYAAGLKAKPLLLWPARIGLLAIFVVHVVTAIRLTLSNRRAKGQGYQIVRTNKATLASLYMMLTGTVILVFIAFHLAHFTFGTFARAGDEASYYHQLDTQGRHDVYSMVVSSFTDPSIGPYYTALYIAAMIALAFHLSHAGVSMFQTAGIDHPGIQRASFAVAWVLAASYIAIPVAIRLGCIALPLEVGHP